MKRGVRRSSVQPSEPDPAFASQHRRLVLQERRILRIAYRLVKSARAGSDTVRRALGEGAQAAREANGNGTGDTVRMVSMQLGLSDTQECRLRTMVDEEHGGGGHGETGHQNK
jgi:hypothetical protein